MGGSQSHEQTQNTNNGFAEEMGPVKNGGVYHALKYAGRIHGGNGDDIDTDNLSTLKNYENSVAGKTKENTIRKIARAMREVGINVNPDDEDLDKIIKDLNKEIPNPKKGKTFAANAKTQAKVCRSVAKVLNNEFGGTLGQNFINMSGSPVEICRTVGEITHSLNQGVNTEFLGVIGSVKNSLHAINLMDQVMANMYTMIQKHIKSANNSYVDREIRPLNDVYMKAKNEKEQKKMVLENLLHIHLEPASEALKHALDEHSRDAALIKKIGLTPGSSSMSDAIASTLTGVGTSTTILNRAHKALKVVGKSMSEYINSHSFKEFEKHLSKIVEQGKMSPDQLEKFIEATEILKQGFKYRKQNVHGGTRQGGRRIKFSGQDEDDFGMPMQSSMRSRAQRVIGTRSIINKDFVVRLDNYYNELLQAILVISKELGKSIPLTSKTELLRDALRHLQNHNGESDTDGTTIEIVITHGINTVAAKEVKEKYINKLKMIANICDQIVSMSVYRNASSMFSKIKEIVLKIEKIIDYYSVTIMKTNNNMSNVGTYDNTYSKSINDPQNILNDNDNTVVGDNDNTVVDDNDNTVVGGNDYTSPLDYEINTPLIAKTGITLNEIINTFNYYYYLASVRNNLKIYSKEYDIFGEDYNNMLGNSIAKRLYDLERDYTIDVKTFISDVVNDPNLKDSKDEIRKWIDNEYNIKIKFYKALQALDLYLKEFTPAITSNIDAVKEIKSMLDETQVIARWYNESTGNYLVNAFEQLPGSKIKNRDIGEGIEYTNDTDNNIYKMNTTGHYYTQIYEKYNCDNFDDKTHFGDPIFGLKYNNKKSNIKTMKDSIYGALDHFQALKNIINTFIRIGNKFGTVDLSTKIFMSPSQIYKILFNYLKQSALRIYVPNNNIHPKHKFNSNMNLQNNNGERIISHYTNINDSNGHGFIKPYDVYFTGNANMLGDIGEGRQCLNNYEVEDKFFHLMIKAMAGKIMTVVGSYDMLEMTPPKHWITNTRIILGGGKKRGSGKKIKGGDGIENPVSPDDNLEIIKEALPLYFKLPRLIEFYRDILSFNGDMKNSAADIAFLPDLDGTFTQLFLLIFRRSGSPENGDYSDSELHKIVEEINNIYNYYVKQNTSNDITTSVIEDIVIDINRKYGLIKKEEYNIWVKMTKENSNLSRIRINNTNYSILPDENEFEVNSMAPSDIYKSVINDSVKIVDYDNDNNNKKTDLLTGKEYSPFSAETPLISEEGNIPHLEMIKKFRSKIDSFFQDAKLENMPSYTILVHQAEDNVKRAKTNKEKISIVFQLIQGTGHLGIKNDKEILFNETIISGLNVLMAIEKLIEDYSNRINKLDPFELEKKCMDQLHKTLLGLSGIDFECNKEESKMHYIINDSNIGNFLDNFEPIFDAYPDEKYYYEHNSDDLSSKYLINNLYINEPVFRGSPIFAKINNYPKLGINTNNIVEDKDNLYGLYRHRNASIELHRNKENKLCKGINKKLLIADGGLDGHPKMISEYHLSYNVLSIFRLQKFIAEGDFIILSKDTTSEDDKYILPSELINKENLRPKDNISIDNYVYDPNTSNLSPVATDNKLNNYLLYLRTMSRISVDYQKIMQELLESIFSLVIDSNGLIDLSFVKIENNKTKLQLNFKKLENLVNGIINDLKYYLEYFRPFMKENIINMYEKLDNKGSIYSMEDTFNKLFNSTLDMYNTDNNEKYTIDIISKNTENVFSNLIRDTLVSFDNLSNYEFIKYSHMEHYIKENLQNKYNTPNTSKTPLSNHYEIDPDTQFNKRKEWYGNTLSNLIFYDFSKKLPYIAPNIKDALRAEMIPVLELEDNDSTHCYYNASSDIVRALASMASVDDNSYKPLFYIYNVIALYDDNSSNSTNTFSKMDDYIQWSASRTGINPAEIVNDKIEVTVNDDDIYCNIEDLNSFSYPKTKSSKSGNYSYNMGIYDNKIEEPIFPSNDSNYKLSILIAKSPKDKDSSYRHLIQFTNASANSNQKEYSRLPLYDNKCLYNDHNSLMFIFNQILSRYISAFVDPSTGNKIYKNLLNSFVNGIASKITSSPNLGFPDLIKSGTMDGIDYVSGHNSGNNLNNSKKSMFFQKSLGLRGDVKGESIIFQSLAYILQRISKDIDPRNNINIHLLNTLTDVPLYMKESYKANLPSFIKIFDFIIQKSEFFKNIIQKTNINLSRYNQCDFANFINSCTGLTDVRINEVRYELNTYQIMPKYYLGRSIYMYINDTTNNNNISVVSPDLENGPENSAEDINDLVANFINLGRNTPEDPLFPYIPFHTTIDNIYQHKIKSSDNVKISCTRGTRGYNLDLITFPSRTPIIDGITNNSDFLKIKDSNANINGFLSVDGLDKFTSKNESSELFKNKLTSILDSIIAHSYTILSCADEVLKELGDTPVYFETFDGSIENYKARNNNDQFMPLSLSFWFLGKNESLADNYNNGPTNTLFGGYNLGTSHFKMLYGVRQLLGRNSAITFDQIPGVKTLLNNHNSTSVDSQIEESKYLQFINRLVTLLRFTVNINGYKKIVAYDSNNQINLFPANKPNLHLYAINNTKESILQILEDSYQENSIIKLLTPLKSTKLNKISRKNERIQVIIDSGINPINIHALMQDIPLANIYNYAYTFETMTASMYGLPISNIEEKPMERINPNKHTIYQFLKFLKNPFMYITPEEFSSNPLIESNLIYNIFSGDSSLGMGRPKFLSDQLFNKCLLQNISITPYQNEQGPQYVNTKVLLNSAIGGNPMNFNVVYKDNLAYINDYLNTNAAIYKKYIYNSKDTINNYKTYINLLFPSITISNYNDPTLIKLSALNMLDNDLKIRIPAINIDTNILKRIRTTLISEYMNKDRKLKQVRDQNTINWGSDNPYYSKDFKALYDDITYYPKIQLRGLKSAFEKSTIAIMTYLKSYDEDLTSKDSTNSVVQSYIYSDAILPPPLIEPKDLKKLIPYIGFNRFNTNIVRNMFFISNILRIIRLQINREFTQNRNILKSSHFAISPSITEYGTMDPNEVYESTYRGTKSFNDEFTPDRPDKEEYYDEV